MNTDDGLTERKCYVCGEDLTSQYKNDNSDQQNDLNASTQKFPVMILWDGMKKEVCGGCYKSYVDGLKVYKEKNPDFKLPDPREY